MKESTFKLIDAINREGLTNDKWGIAHDIESTAEYFGDKRHRTLKGQWLYIYINMNDTFCFLDVEEKQKPDLWIHTEVYEDLVALYKI